MVDAAYVDQQLGELARDEDLYYLHAFYRLDGDIPKMEIYRRLAAKYYLTVDGVRRVLWRIRQPESPFTPTPVRRIKCNDLGETVT